MFKYSDEEDSFFAPKESKTTLSSIFNIQENNDRENGNKVSNNISNKDLTRGVIKPLKIESSVVIAKVVHAYKLLNNSYEIQGRLGLALTSYSNNTYTLILYKSKDEHLFNVLLTPSTTVYVLENNYITLNDNQNANWSLLFNNNEDFDSFIEQLKRCKVILKNYQKNETNNLPTNKEPTQNLEQEFKIEKKSECDSSDTKTKAKILTRVAKLGQNIFPLKSDSDESESIGNRKIKKSSKRNESLDKVVPFTPIYHYPQNHPVFTPINQTFPQNNFPQFDFNVYIAENRTQYSEMRMHLMKLENKIEKVLDERHDRKVSFDSNPDQIVKLENKMKQLETDNKLKNEMVLKFEDTLNEQQTYYLDKLENFQTCLNQISKGSDYQFEHLFNELNDIKIEIKNNNFGRNFLDKFHSLNERILTEQNNLNFNNKIKEYENKIEILNSELKQKETDILATQQNNEDFVKEILKKDQNFYSNQIKDLENEIKLKDELIEKLNEEYEKSMNDLKEDSMKIVESVNLSNEINKINQSYTIDGLKNNISIPKQCLDKLNNDIKNIMNSIYNKLSDDDLDNNDMAMIFRDATFMIIKKIENNLNGNIK